MQLIEQTAIEIGRGVVGPDRNRLVEILERRLRLLAIHPAAADIADGVVGIDGRS